MRRTIAVLLGVIALLAVACADDGGGETADPDRSSTSSSTSTSTTTSSSTTTTEPPRPEIESVVVTGPIEGGNGLANAAIQDLGAAGYEEEEFFIEGDATSYALVGEGGVDGFWDAAPSTTAEYRTRLVVRRPVDPGDFSGVVVVEWFNVSGGGDGDPDWGYLHPELLREGHAWVGVSAQAVGVGGGTTITGEEALVGGLVEADAERYGSLVHPGDAFSYDMYSQAGAAIRNPDGPSPLGELELSHVIAVGESQSAIFLTTYVNAVHPLVGVFDGFLLHSRGGAGPSLEGSRSREGGDRIRTDLTEPVLIFETETDLTALGYLAARQDDTDTVRTWEVAGTAHADAHLLEDVYGLGSDTDVSAILNCSAPVNAGPQYEVLVAGFHHLVDWVRDGTLPPVSPRLEIDGSAIARDEYGNALGGIRTPLVDVPVATLSGDPPGEGGGTFCFLFGSTTPFDAATLAALYPTPADYVDAFTASADEAVAAGFVLRPEADEMIAEAEAFDLAG